MEPENINTEETKEEVKVVEEGSVLNKVTPLSKYLAMILFIILPFIGGWIGYNSSPEKVVEVERVVVKEAEVAKKVTQVTEVEEDDVRYISVEKGLPEHRSYTYDLGEDKTGWLLYENEEFGFSFLYPPDFEIIAKTIDDDSSSACEDKKQDLFSIESGTPSHRFIPTVLVAENCQGLSTVQQLDKVAYGYTDRIDTTVIDGRPAFWECTAEGGGCSGYVVTENFIFRLGSITNIEFDDAVAGKSDLDVEWPEEVAVPKLY
jgi:hypothetical protein